MAINALKVSFEFPNVNRIFVMVTSIGIDIHIVNFVNVLSLEL